MQGQAAPRVHLRESPHWPGLERTRKLQTARGAADALRRQGKRALHTAYGVDVRMRCESQQQQSSLVIYLGPYYYSSAVVDELRTSCQAHPSFLCPRLWSLGRSANGLLVECNARARRCHVTGQDNGRLTPVPRTKNSYSETKGAIKQRSKGQTRRGWASPCYWQERIVDPGCIRRSGRHRLEHPSAQICTSPRTSIACLPRAPYFW